MLTSDAELLDVFFKKNYISKIADFATSVCLSVAAVTQYETDKTASILEEVLGRLCDLQW
jgi:hypothetical protein